MPMLATLNLPKAPVWATDSGRVLDPDDTSGTGTILKEHGWDIDQRSPARVENWLNNIHYQQIQRLRGIQLMNWTDNVAISGNKVQDMIFHPDIGIWLATNSTTTPYYSYDGHAWSAGSVLAFGANRPSAAIDTSYYMTGNSNNDIQYSADAGVSGWSTIASATIGGSGTIEAIHTSYPDSDLTLVVRSGGIRIAATGITGSWASPSTPPPSPPAAPNEYVLIYIGSDNTWLLLLGDSSNESKLYRSTDDGDTWAETSPGINPIFPSASTGAKHMAYDRDAGRLILVGSLDPVNDTDYIAYSDDLGDNWTDVSSGIDAKGRPNTTNYPEKIYYCGGGCWVAGCKVLDPVAANTRTIYVSTDSGITWQIADLHGGGINDECFGFACDQRKIICFSNLGFNAYSLAT